MNRNDRDNVSRETLSFWFCVGNVFVEKCDYIVLHNSAAKIYLKNYILTILVVNTLICSE